MVRVLELFHSGDTFSKRFGLDITKDLKPITISVRCDEKNIITFYAGSYHASFRKLYVDTVRIRLDIVEEYLVKGPNDFCMYVFKTIKNIYGAMVPIVLRG